MQSQDGTIFEAELAGEKARQRYEDLREREADESDACTLEELTAAIATMIRVELPRIEALERLVESLTADKRQPCECAELWRLARAFADATEPVQITDTASAIATYVREHS